MDRRQVLGLVAEVLGTVPLAAERMTLTHSGNTIFDVTLPDRQVIVRLRGPDKDTLSKTAHNLYALAELGLPVPRVLMFDTSLRKYPFRYIILEKIPGRDLLYELPDMTPAQMTSLAEKIVAVQRVVATLPPGTGFGWGHVGEGGSEPAWFDVLPPEYEPPAPILEGTPLADFQSRLFQQRRRFQPYFQAVRPVCFLEDLTTKNVLLQEGEIQGLIDFDCVCFGDPLWMIGLTAGCVINDVGNQGLFYIEELCRCWTLTEEQRRIVTYYAAQRSLSFLEYALTEQDKQRVERITTAVEQWLEALEP